jgi:Zn-dependent protease with chaperone function
MDSRSTRLLAPVGVVVAVIVFAILAAVSVTFVVALIVGVVLGAAVVALLWSRADSMVLGSLRVERCDEDTQPRVHNVLNGLCDSHGFRKPQVLIVDDTARNAVAYGRHAKQPVLALTSGLVNDFDLLQLEALLARELATLDDSSRPAATVAVPLRRWLPRAWGEAITARVQGRERAIRDDFEAVRYTRYPPGLASALAAMAGGTAVRGAPRAGMHLWVADPTANDEATNADWKINQRVEALREL